MRKTLIQEFTREQVTKRFRRVKTRHLGKTVSCSSGAKSVLVKRRGKRSMAEKESRRRSLWALDSMLRSLGIFFRQRVRMGLLAACRFDLSPFHLPLTSLPGRSLVVCDWGGPNCIFLALGMDLWPRPGYFVFYLPGQRDWLLHENVTRVGPKRLNPGTLFLVGTIWYKKVLLHWGWRSLIL